MKRIVACLLGFISVIIIFTGCVTFNKVLTKEEVLSQTVTAIATEITKVSPLIASARGNDEEGYDIYVAVPSSIKYSVAGNYFKKLCERYSEVDFDVKSFGFAVFNEHNKPQFVFDTSDFASGLFVDYRTGEDELIRFKSLDELNGLLPEMTVEDALAESELFSDTISDEDFKKYNEVMDALNADFNKSEDEIFEELAPKYNCTAEELKQFMKDNMAAAIQRSMNKE